MRAMGHGVALFGMETPLVLVTVRSRRERDEGHDQESCCIWRNRRPGRARGPASAGGGVCGSGRVALRIGGRRAGGIDRGSRRRFHGHRLLGRYTYAQPIAGAGAAANAILGSGLTAIVLTPALYLENLTIPLFAPRLREEGILDYPPIRPSQRITWTSQVDQARVVVAAFGNPELAGTAYGIGSRGPLTCQELAGHLSGWVGRRVTCALTTPAAFGQRVAMALGSPASGAVPEALYIALSALPDDGHDIDVAAVEAAFGVTLSSPGEHIAGWT